MTNDTLAPLVQARDYLRSAHRVLSHERLALEGTDLAPELDAVLDDLTALLLKLKAVGKDGHWGE